MIDTNIEPGSTVTVPNGQQERYTVASPAEIAERTGADGSVNRVPAHAIPVLLDGGGLSFVYPSEILTVTGPESAPWPPPPSSLLVHITNTIDPDVYGLEAKPQVPPMRPPAPKPLVAATTSDSFNATDDLYWNREILELAIDVGRTVTFGYKGDPRTIVPQELFTTSKGNEAVLATRDGEYRTYLLDDIEGLVTAV